MDKVIRGYSRWNSMKLEIEYEIRNRNERLWMSNIFDVGIVGEGFNMLRV